MIDHVTASPDVIGRPVSQRHSHVIMHINVNKQIHVRISASSKPIAIQQFTEKYYTKNSVTLALAFIISARTEH